MANQHNIDTTFIERYVLNQLNEEEALRMRGEIMLNDSLRKEVRHVQHMLASLQTIAAEPEFSALTTTMTRPFYAAKNFKFAVAAATILLVSSFFLFIYQSPKTITTETTIPVVTPVEEENTIEIPIRTEEVIPFPTEPAVSSSTNEPKVYAAVEEAIVSKEKEEKSQIFAFAGGVSNSDEIYEENRYLERKLYGASSVKSGVSISTDFLNSTKIKRADDIINLQFSGKLRQKLTSNLILKVYTNQEGDYINDLPLIEKNITRVNTSKNFDVDLNLELEKGLYYFTILEATENDIIYTGKFYAID